MGKNRVAITLVLVALATAGVACAVPGVTRPTPQPTPTAPTVAPQLTPVPVQPANELEAQVEAVYSEAAPAVVNVTSRIITYDFFMQPVPQEGTGSGFIYDTEGHIVTNYHVVENAESVSVALTTGETYVATVVGADPSNDLAVLRTEAETLPAPMPLGDSDRLRVGQFVIALGNPFGLNFTLTVGVISSLGRVIQSPDGRFIGEAIQTDAAINPGNSGGPLLDLEGRVIGVNAQIISPSQASAGIGFAIPANTVRRVVPQLIAQGRYPHPWLGVQILEITPQRASALREAGVDVPVDEGVLVVEVVPGSPAAAAGIRGGDREVQIGNARVLVGGDVITAINSQPVATSQELTVYLESETQVGDAVEVTLMRGRQEMTVSVTLAERPEQQ